MTEYPVSGDQETQSQSQGRISLCLLVADGGLHLIKIVCVVIYFNLPRVCLYLF